MARLSRAETETIIRRSDDERYWDVYSACPRDVRRLRKCVEAFGGEIKEGEEGEIRARIPLRAITFRASAGSSSGGFGKAKTTTDMAMAEAEMDRDLVSEGKSITWKVQ